jgi:tetratricopeptide (TPR) repeat protein
MGVNPLSGKPLELEPLDETPSGRAPACPPATESSADEKVQHKARVAAVDEFLAQAAKEYQSGRIDRDLWERTSAPFDGNKALLVPAYLRLRARALKQQKRDEQGEERPRKAGSTSGSNNAGRLGGIPHFKYILVAMTIAAIIVVVWQFASPRDSEPVPQSVVVAAVAKKPAASPNSRASEPAIIKNASDPASQVDPGAALEAKVLELERAGNWNVMVLYASEWTRKRPDNAVAWTKLSVGYGKLRQLGDALEAATKAVQLAPDDSRHWRNLGHVYLTLERFPEARIAFDKVLAVNAEDVDALCGAALVAKGQGRAKDADAIVARLKSIGLSCDGASDSVSSAVIAGGSAAPKAVPRSR